MAKQYDKVDLFINLDKKETKEQIATIKRRAEEKRMEKKRQEETGVVLKPDRIGRKSYKMKKTDFQMEDELAGSLRQVRPIGKDDFLRDRFDSVFRTNKLDVVDVVNEAEKKRRDKANFKFKQRSGAAYGSVAEKLDRKNKKAKAEFESRSKKGFL